VNSVLGHRPHPSPNDPTARVQIIQNTLAGSELSNSLRLIARYSQFISGSSFSLSLLIQYDLKMLPVVGALRNMVFVSFFVCHHDSVHNISCIRFVVVFWIRDMWSVEPAILASFVSHLVRSYPARSSLAATSFLFVPFGTYFTPQSEPCSETKSNQNIC